MSPSKAIGVLEERHKYLMGRAQNEENAAKRNYILAELSALEIGIEAVADDIAEYRELRAARYAMQQHLSEASC